MSGPRLPALLELQARPQWVCWHREQRKDKDTDTYQRRGGTCTLHRETLPG